MIPDDTGDDTGDAPNEILAAARDAKAHKEAAKAVEKAKSWPLAKIGLAAGIGSTAIAAAMLFAQRDRSAK